jgi:flagellar biosynthesis protein FlhG
VSLAGADDADDEEGDDLGGRPANEVAQASSVRVIACGGGKGGVGKTFLTANLAAALAKLGHRVLAVDTDLEGANLHTCLGVNSPRVSMADFVDQREDDLTKLTLETSDPNLTIIAGTNANLGSPHPSHSRQVRLMRGLRRQQVDFVLLDLGAGSHASVLDYFLMADDALITLQPEPTSVENAYTFLRAAFYRRMRLAMVGHGVRKLVTQAMDHRNEKGIRTPFDLLQEVESLDPEEGIRFVQTIGDLPPRIVGNGVRTAEVVKLGC